MGGEREGGGREKGLLAPSTPPPCSPPPGMQPAPARCHDDSWLKHHNVRTALPTAL